MMAAPRNPAKGHSPRLAAPERQAPPYDILKQAILRGELQAGQQLVEATLASWCNVSRTPIREALSRLEQDGLVYRSDRGMIVRQRSPEEILDVYEVRLVLEATAARVAAERRTEHEVRLLRRLLQQGEEVSGDDPTAMAETNRVFHRAIWRASHNESLIDLLERLTLHLARYPETTLAYGDRWNTSKREHRAIVDAIEERDGAASHDLALKHFTEARDIRLALYDEELIAASAQPSRSRRGR
jgi:DNA-binding GntR family transcriptional regulator